MTRALTKDQRRAVETVGRDLCVVAGAGTGKTHVLTERIVRRVGAGLDLRRLLAITFTEKAAAEMKHRLGAALLDAGLEDARERVDAAAISTVHAFCARLLREHAVAAGVDPQFRVLEDVEADRLRRAALADLVVTWRAEAPERYRWLSLLPGMDPAEALLDIHRQARESGRTLREFVALPPQAPSVLAAVARSVDAVEDLVALGDPGTPKSREKVERIRVLLPALREASTAEAALEAAQALVEFVVLGVPKGAKARFTACRDALDALVSVALEHRLAPLRGALADALEDLDASYEVAKGTGTGLDFADLELRAVRLLDEHPPARDAVRGRYEDCLVDEFQDTNPLQARLVDLLQREGGLFVVGDPKQAIYGFRGSEVSVFADRMERVGPAGVVTLAASFRSRPEVLAAVNGLFADGTVSRGRPYEPLVAGRDFAEPDRPCVELQVCEGARAASGRRLEADWIARRIHALVEGGGGEGPLRVTDKSSDDPLATRPAGYGDVAVLLRVMSNVKALEHALTAHDVPYLVVKGRGFYHAREVVDLANLLACVDNPADDVRLASVLRAPLCGASDDALFVLAAERRSGRDSLADVLAAWAVGGLALPDLPETDAAALRRFDGTLRRLRGVRATSPLAVLVDLALSETDLIALSLARPNGRQRAANLRKVRAFARDADRRGDVDLRGFVDTMADLRAREVRETEAPVAAAARGAVSLLTVHAAKGLEFPIVFVPDVTRNERGGGEAVPLHPTGGLGLPDVFKSKVKRHTRPWSDTHLRELCRNREKAESLRLLYVATTRASDHLVLSGARFGTAKAGLWYEQIAGTIARRVALPAAADVVELLAPPGQLFGPPLRVHAAACSAAEDVPEARTLLRSVIGDLCAGRPPTASVGEEGAAQAARLWEEAARPVPPPSGTLYATTVSALVDFAACPAAFHRRHVLGLPDAGEPIFPRSAAGLFVGEGAGSDAAGSDAFAADGPGRAGDDDEWGVPLDARARGRAVHLALERLVPEFTGDVRAEARAALTLETGGSAPDPDDVARVTAWVEGFAASRLGRDVAAVPRARVRREQAFLLRRGRTVVRGQIDLLFRGEEGWSVVDYKAGELDAPTDAYALQMRLYALALREITGERVPRLALFSLPSARAVAVPCSEDDLDVLESGILAEFESATRDEDYAACGRRDCSVCGRAT